jgi:hypothetical protein
LDFAETFGEQEIALHVDYEQRSMFQREGKRVWLRVKGEHRGIGRHVCRRSQ